MVKDENGDLLAGSPNTLTRWKNYFSQVPNVVGDVRQRKIQLSHYYMGLVLLRLRLLLQS
jgi:hypothetical protein